MQRIWITGSSGSGKTTLANRLGKKLNIHVFHRDQITWMENWQERSEEEQIKIVKEITIKEKWIFDGNRFTASKVDGRFDNCDTLIHLNINRFLCLYRGIRRYFEHKNDARADLSKGCDEEYGMEAVKYVLYGYPSKRSKRQELFAKAEKLGKKVIILNDHKSLKKWCVKMNL